MIHINKPLKECDIILTEMLAADAETPRKLMGTVKFKTVAHLGSYLSGARDVAASICYHLKTKT